MEFVQDVAQEHRDDRTLSTLGKVLCRLTRLQYPTVLVHNVIRALNCYIECLTLLHCSFISNSLTITKHTAVTPVAETV